MRWPCIEKDLKTFTIENLKMRLLDAQLPSFGEMAEARVRRTLMISKNYESIIYDRYSPHPLNSEKEENFYQVQKTI